MTDNYRGISLIGIIAKLFNRLILNHIIEVVDLSQNGFRTKRTIVSQILAIRGIIEGIKNKS